MKGYEIKFHLYADNEAEVADARQAIIGFISEHAQQGRAVTARKIAEAVRNWKNNVIVKNRIINYFKN